MTRIVGAGPDLALIHGWGLGSSVWQPLIAALSRTWRVHLVDLPGYGDSSAGSPDFTQAARDLIDALPDPVTLCGWSLGAMLAMRAALLVPQRVAALLLVGATASFTQRAGLAALTGPQDDVTKMVAEFKRRRDAFIAALNTLPGFRCRMPEGAFYAFPNITGTGLPAKQLADDLLQRAGVACLSGTAFGAYGEGYLRFSYANSLENLLEAVERIRSFLAR